MKPLVYYCRWQGASLRLRGRDESAVWGQFVYRSEDGPDKILPFHFNLRTSQLLIQQEGGDLSIKLDEMGVPVDQP